VVVVRGVDAMADEDWSVLEAYVPAPAAMGRLVLTAEPNVSAAVRQRFAKLLTVEELTLETPQQRAAWVRSQLADHQQACSPQAFTMLQQHLDLKDNPSQALQVLEQISLYAGEQQRIMEEAVAAFVRPTVTGTGFALADAIGAGETAEALRLLTAQLPDPRRAPEVVGLLVWHLRRVWLGRVRLESGVPPAVAARELGVPRLAAERWSAQVRRWSLPALGRAVRLLLDVDARLKRGESHPRLALELAVLQLLRVPDEQPSEISCATPRWDAESLSLSPDQSA